MDLHFCSRCGISIPQSEIDSGSAGGPGGKFFCSEHRGGAAVAVAESPRPGDVPDPELLFCANCRVSIPLADVKSGRAHREFGSLLCAGCSKADPGERSARREAVEAEMAADVEAQDPVVARRCSVCSAVVPYGQIVTGKAKVDGNRVVCERCRAASDTATAAAGTSRGFPSGLVLFAVVLVAGGLGFYATQKWLDQRHESQTKEAGADTKALRDEIAKLNRRLDDFDTRLAESIRRSMQPDERAAADRERIDADVANVRQMTQDLRADVVKSDVDLAQRVAKLEGMLSGLSDRVRDLAARAPAAPTPAPPVEPPRNGGTAEQPPVAPPSKPPAPAVNPQVAKLCKDLLDPAADDGTRFTAATELTTLKDPAAIPSLVKALADDKHYFVRRGCARALGVMKAWLAVPALIKALEDREVYVALAANIALQNITGNDFGITQDTPAGQRRTKAQAAEKWWEKNRDKPPDGVSLHPITD